MADDFTILKDIPDFESRITDDRYAMTESMDVLQINVGRLCNLACKHCHMEAGPLRTEVMGREVMEACLAAYKKQGFSTIDITGGAPEMNPDFRWLVQEACALCPHVIVRTNLVIMLEDGYEDLPEFYAERDVELVCSLPHYKAKTTDKQRGAEVFNRSIRVLQRLNELGYGRKPELVLNMVYNPAGAFFPPDQTAMEREYKEHLGRDYGIAFNQLFTITNNPSGRFREFLERSGNLEDYMNKLCTAFNPATLQNMMCRYQVSVGYDGSLYDCDFNQAIGLKISTGESIFDLAERSCGPRRICFGKHCYTCTAGAGSSCGGTTEA